MRRRFGPRAHHHLAVYCIQISHERISESVSKVIDGVEGVQVRMKLDLFRDEGFVDSDEVMDLLVFEGWICM